MASFQGDQIISERSHQDVAMVGKMWLEASTMASSREHTAGQRWGEAITLHMYVFQVHGMDGLVPLAALGDQ